MQIREAHRLIVVVGPSGAGKDSVLRAWRQGLPVSAWVHFARRTVTRAAHAGSEDHEPIAPDEFAAEAARGGFALQWSAHGLRYGIRGGELAPLARGGWVVMNGSRGHLGELRAAAPGARIVAIDAPLELRRVRLGERGREADGPVEARLQRELVVPDADLTIVNDGSIADAVARLDAWWRALPAPAARADLPVG